MARLNIKNAPLLTSIIGTEKIPTGTRGDYTITPDLLATYLTAKLPFVTKQELSQLKTNLENQITTVETNLSQSISLLSQRVSNVETEMVGFTQDLTLHKADQSNPHKVTKQQIGLGSVDNTSDINKPLSNANKAYVDALSNNLKLGIPTTYSKTISNLFGGYSLGSTLLLNDSVTEVVSVVSNNTANPNLDMTGWVLKSFKASDVFDSSGKSQQEINTVQKKTVINVANYALNNTDNTAVFNQIVSDAPNNAKIVFPYNQELKGHFISKTKAFNIDFNNCTLISTLDDQPIVQIGDLASTQYIVAERFLLHGANSFSVVNASSLFKVGDIGYLWDGAVRPTGGDVNYEAVKIRAIAGDLITVDGFLASYKGAGVIRFYHQTSQLKNASFKNLNLKPTSTHNFITSLIASVENPHVSNVETVGTVGASVCIRNCYGLTANNIRPLYASKVGDGQGYGLQLYCVSKFIVNNVNGSSMRHVYDQDSAYFGTISNVSDDDDKSSPVALAHNGFAGYCTLDGVRVTTSQYPINLSGQGYGGAVSALKRNHPFRSIVIKNVVATIRADATLESGTYGVYFQNNIVNCHVDNLNVTTLNTSVITSVSTSLLIRINGISTGGSTFGRLAVNRIGKILYASSSDRDTFAFDYSKIVIRDVTVSEIAYLCHLQGLYFIDVDNVSVANSVYSNILVFMQVISSDQPYGAFVGKNVWTRLSGIALLSSNATSNMQGCLSTISKSIASSVSIVAGQSLTIQDIQDRSALVRLVPPTGVATIALNATTALPKPQTIGDELYISVPAGRNNVTFPAGSNITAHFTINAGETVRLVTLSSKWSLSYRSYSV